MTPKTFKEEVIESFNQKFHPYSQNGCPGVRLDDGNFLAFEKFIDSTLSDLEARVMEVVEEEKMRPYHGSNIIAAKYEGRKEERARLRSALLSIFKGTNER